MSLAVVPLFGVYHDAEMEQRAAEVMRSRQIAAGPYVAQFEKHFGALIGSPYIVTVNDMSNAVQIALRLADIGPGDEVLSTAYACMSTNAPIALSGARVAWVDVHADSGTMDPQALEKAITPRSKAVLLYHPAGYPADAARIREICDERGLKLIEDCDNALLATLDGRQVGSWGDYAIFSFYPNRQINATEGGAIVCRRLEDAVRARRLRKHGIDIDRFRDALGEINPDSDIAEIGFAATLNNLCAAIGESQLTSVPQRVETSRKHADLLTQHLSTTPGLRVVRPLRDSRPSGWVLLLLMEQRDRAMRSLKQAGIQCSKLHHQTNLYSAFGPTNSALPATRHFMGSVLAVPCGWWLQAEQLQRLLDALTSCKR